MTNPTSGPILRNTLLQDRIRSPQDAIIEIYRRLRPGDPPTVESATNFFNNLFFNPDRYDLSKVGRLKFNHRLRAQCPFGAGTLRKEDILEVVRYLMELKNGNGSVDDIDHLGNRRVRAVGELVENHFRVGLVRMERAIKEKMSLAGHRDLDAPGADQLQAGFGGAQRIFRIEPAVAVHGSNQSAYQKSPISGGFRPLVRAV